LVTAKTPIFQLPGNCGVTAPASPLVTWLYKWITMGIWLWDVIFQLVICIFIEVQMWILSIY